MGALFVLVFGSVGVILLAAVIRILAGIIVATIVCLPAEWAWDNVMPALFGLPDASIGQVWFLAFLLTLLIPHSTARSNSSSD